MGPIHDERLFIWDEGGATVPPINDLQRHRRAGVSGGPHLKSEVTVLIASWNFRLSKTRPLFQLHKTRSKVAHTKLSSQCRGHKAPRDAKKATVS